MLSKLATANIAVERRTKEEPGTVLHIRKVIATTFANVSILLV